MKVKIFKIRMGDQLHQDEELLNQFMENVSVKKTATEFVPDKINYWAILIYYENGIIQDKQDSIMGVTEKKISYPSDSSLNNEEGIVYNALRKWRNEIAIKTSLPGYMICNRSELVTIAKFKPKNLEELGKIKGFSSKKLMKYGNDVLALLNSV